MDKFFIVIMLLITNVCLSQIGIGTESPKADLDINYFTKFSSLPDVSQELKTYKMFLYVDNEGYLGGLGVKSYIPGANYYQGMNTAVILAKSQSLLLEEKITVPPYTKSLIEISYNIPIVQKSGRSGEFAILLSKTSYDYEQFIDGGTRRYILENTHVDVDSYLGRNVSNVHYEQIENTTSSPLVFTFKLYGTTDSDDLTNFGMAKSSPTDSYLNFGKGFLFINVFD